MYEYLKEGYRRFSSTKGFVQLGVDVETIIGSAYPGFSFGGGNQTHIIIAHNN